MFQQLNEKLDALRVELEQVLEGRSYRIGTVRRRRGGNFQKHEDGWRPLKVGLSRRAEQRFLRTSRESPAGPSQS